MQTPQGWVFVNRGLMFEGEVMELPPAPTVSVTAAQALTLYSRPSRDFDRLAVIKQGEQDIAFGRDETGIWLQIPGGWVSTEQGLELDGDVMRLPITGYAGITIIAHLRTGIRSGPSEKGQIGFLQRGEEAIAFGRNEKATRLQIERGWVLASYVKADGDIMSLPVTSGESSTQFIAKASSRDGVTIRSTAGSTIRSESKSGRNVVGNLQRGEKAIAIGRNESGRYLQIERGWVLASYVKADGDIMSLPITSSTTVRTTTTSARRATPTPSRSSSLAFNEQSIRSQVNRYTDDIRILKISQRGSTTDIEYDLKPWPFVPNEQIAHEVLFKVICALRRGGQIPHKLEFTGQGHFKSDVGRKFKSPSVEIHISANDANRIICGGNNYTDINWRKLAAHYRSYPIPSGARVDYD